MFKKIVSNLPFSPALVGQLGFYAKRLRKEDTTRRLALIFVALTVVVQSLAIFSPADPANAASANDMVYGGIGQSIDNFLKPYDANTLKIKDVMNYTGITREEIAAAKYTSWQAGTTLSWGFVPHFSYAQGERQHSITDSTGKIVTTIYSRPLSLWHGASNTVYGWVGNSKSMGWFAIMQVCGNLVTNSIPSKPIVIEKPAEPTEPIIVPDTTPITTPTPEPETKPVVPTSNPEPRCVLNSSLLASDSNCKPCPGNESIWINDKSCTPNVVKSKTSINISQNFINSSTAIAKPNDQIRYAITAENTGLNSATTKLEDNLSDILEYSTLIDNGGGSLNTSTGVLSWPDVTLSPTDKQTRTYTVKLLEKMPTTPQGISNSTSFDCKMSNTFGNIIDIKVDCPTVKAIETVVTALPKTGPGENMIFACIILAVATYFYSRTRQLEKEIRIVRKNANAGTI